MLGMEENGKLVVSEQQDRLATGYGVAGGDV